MHSYVYTLVYTLEYPYKPESLELIQVCIAMLSKGLKFKELIIAIVQLLPNELAA